MVTIDSGPMSGGTRLLGISAKRDPTLPLVSVITAVMNGSKCIAECIESVLNQDYPNIEHIILDGVSKDGTVEILRKYQDRIAFWKSEPDKGVYDAWNKGLNLAQGEWIAFLGSDDIYRTGAISIYVDLARSNPGVEFLSSRAQLIHSTGYSPIFGGPWEWELFRREMSTIHVGCLHRRDLFSRFGQFDTSYRIAGDYEFLLRMRHSLKTAFTPTVTVSMRAGGLSDSTAGLKEARRAKIESRVRAPLAATVDCSLATTRFYFRNWFLIIRAAVMNGRRGSLREV